ncbi:RGS domain-containing protein [Fimicolochytrium jonesii]|uniref:RGS domain-containing protein n=1 Tax=Fimicolochytrium jonesii TaxID=1396493 RepID=UPI0022FEAA75|nr:RGS domain-containing protein [Fimicolochytrium jonesii]KAI8822913.1 RGS domain-containing protein [Fimicolochytrium jonesii]
MQNLNRNKYKITLTAVLQEEHESPFALEDFEKFVAKEHSEENLDFWNAVNAYRVKASRVFPNCPPTLRVRRQGSHSSMRSISAAFQSTASLGSKHLLHSTSEEALPEKDAQVDPADQEKLKDDIDAIVKTYLLPGSEKEVNLPALMRKKVLAEITEKKNWHPDVFKTPLEHVYTIMKTSTYPNFYKQACAYLTERNLPFPDRRISETGETEYERERQNGVRDEGTVQ